MLCFPGKGKFLLPGATAAVLVMLGALHARRMYDDNKVSRRRFFFLLLLQLLLMLHRYLAFALLPVFHLYYY
jgi:hypothetical protein